MHPPQPVEYGLMSDRHRPEADSPKGDSREEGLFGKLPSARPGVRSPRRRAGGPKARPTGPPTAPGSAPGQAEDKPPPSAAELQDPATASPGVRRTDTRGDGSPPLTPTEPGTAREPDAPGGDEAPREPGASGGDGPGMENLAWAGVTVAAEAATLGVRLLSRALEAVRGPADKR